MDLDGLPMPARDLINNDLYSAVLGTSKLVTSMITSRGCPYRCAFCSVHKTFGYKCRRRSAENILAEIRQRYTEGYRVFDFEDDNLTFDRKEMIELCEQLICTFPEKDIQLLAMNGVCYWTLDRDILKLMRRAGFTHLNLSLVSTNTDLLKKVRRPNPLKKYRDVIRHATTLGFKIVAYQILGLPGDTLSSMIKTLLFNARLPVLLGASPFYLIPHSPIARDFGHDSPIKITGNHDRPNFNSVEIDRYWDSEPAETDIYKARLTAMAIETKDFKREDLYTLLITTRILNFLKGLSFRPKKITLRKALAIAGKLDPRSALGAKILRKLLKEKVLRAATSKGLEPLPRFRPELFFQFWRKLDTIQTQGQNTLRTRGG